MQRIRYQLILAAVLVATIAGIAAADEPAFDPDARAKAIAPFLDEQTFLVVRLDVAKIDPVKLIDRLVATVPELKPQRTMMSLTVGTAHAALLQTGAKQSYAVFSVEEFDFHREPMPSIIIPMQGVNEEMLSLLFSQTPFEVKQRLGDVFFAGYRSALERLKQMTPDERPGLAAAFKAAGDTAAQALFLPPKYTARVIEEMMPELPLNGGPSTILTHGCRWAALGVGAPPKLSARLTVQSEDPEAAAALRRVWHGGLRELGEEKEVRRVLGDFEPLVKLFTPAIEGDRLVLELSDENGGVEQLIGALKTPLQEVRAEAQRSMSMNNLKQFALSLHQYHQKHAQFPSPANYDQDGKPLLSWRVHLLPFLGENALYEQFHLDEPWNSEHNQRLIGKMPKVYRGPASKRAEDGHTPYVVLTGEGTLFPGQSSVQLRDIKDGASNTILVVEVDDERSVLWTKPADLAVDLQKPADGLVGAYDGGIVAAFADGHVQFLRLPMDDARLRALITPTAGDSTSP
ncbi:MAG: DUF1559 domain-containing protein [Pirellulales bacterium]|nr:DUF1559 domain-containing protein [Pirellulales bacterium]